MVVSLLELPLQALDLALELFDYLNLRVHVLLRLILYLTGPRRVVQGADGLGEVLLCGGHTGNHQAVGVAT